MAEPIDVVDYDERWPQVFETLRFEVVAVLGSVALAVEHVGSTSVPGLSAKPIIDMDVVVASRAEVPTAIQRLATIGYIHRGGLLHVGTTRSPLSIESGDTRTSTPPPRAPLAYVRRNCWEGICGNVAGRLRAARWQELPAITRRERAAAIRVLLSRAA
ncbi:MAG TPA: GrpB family protein [Planctomycetota bacterium]